MATTLLLTNLANLDDLSAYLVKIQTIAFYVDNVIIFDVVAGDKRVENEIIKWYTSTFDVRSAFRLNLSSQPLNTFEPQPSVIYVAIDDEKTTDESNPAGTGLLVEKFADSSKNPNEVQLTYATSFEYGGARDNVDFTTDALLYEWIMKAYSTTIEGRLNALNQELAQRQTQLDNANRQISLLQDQLDGVSGGSPSPSGSPSATIPSATFRSSVTHPKSGVIATPKKNAYRQKQDDTLKSDLEAFSKDFKLPKDAFKLPKGAPKSGGMLSEEEVIERLSAMPKVAARSAMTREALLERVKLIFDHQRKPVDGVCTSEVLRLKFVF